MIVCIGDSITAGQLVTEREAWPALLTEPDVVARGVPGDTTRLALERFPRDVQELAPEVAVIQFGHNDANRWQSDRGLARVSIDAYSANLTEMILRCRAFDVQPLICLLTPTARTEQYERDCRRYENAARNAARGYGVPYIDVRAAFGDTPGLLLDGLHLSPAGHRIYADAVQAAIDAWRSRAW